ncbi:MAG TPA: glutamate synthase large subunit [Trueperaceae bacterium]
MMLMPEALNDHSPAEAELQGFYRYHATLMEPWDGPAALALSDGRYAVAALDRNGLRPQRYEIFRDGTVVVGSEAGLTDALDEDIVEKGRLGPGTILAVDTQEGRILRNDEIKARAARRHPYHLWIEAKQLRPQPDGNTVERTWDREELARTQKLFGYHREDYERIFEPMVSDADIPIGSMGDDTPLAVLSDQPQNLFRYFKQRFAQVTNPPIDPLRERLVMSLETVVGPRHSILEESEDAAHVISFTSPIIDAAELAWLMKQDAFRPQTLQARFPVAAGPQGLEPALEALCDAAEAAVAAGAGFLVLSDREAGGAWAPIPMLLATAAVHHRLFRAGTRTRTALVLETGEPREDHHYACLIGYGAALIHPYLAFATARDVPDAVRRQLDVCPDDAVLNYRNAVQKGILKIMSKMGISSISSYRGAQIFEAIGVHQDVIDRYFTGTPSRIGGAGLDAFATDALRFHAEAYGEDPALTDRGIYRFRKAGEYHALNPQVFKTLHKAVRTESFDAFEDYAREVDGRAPCNLRDLLRYRRAATPVPLDDVEPALDIVRRFTTQAMSHGSVSREAHETLSIAMNRLGAKSNSGEGGEDPSRFQPYDQDMPGLSHASWHPKAGDWGNSAIKQVASGRFGVTPAYLISARELEIKMAQGSKPGEGGQIPGHKVSAEIARIRRAVPGVTLISPPPHHDIYSIEDLAQLIYDLKRVNREARVGVKLVSTAGVGTIAAGVAKGYADNIQISGHDGGTGASPLSSVRNAGVPWELGLAETQQVLVQNNLRGRVTLRVDGGLKTGNDVVIAALLGAEEFGFGTAALVAAGCAMLRQCHLNTCPVGVATQREDLRQKYQGRPEHVINFMVYVAQQVRMILSQMGARSMDEIIGRTDLLEVRATPLPKTAHLDISAILADPDPSGRRARKSQQARNDRTDDEAPLDEIIWGDCESAVRTKTPTRKHYHVSNRERSLGARLSGEIARTHGEEGLPSGTIQISLEGSAGQSFGAFNNRGVVLMLDGQAQDYVGKGMYGGEIILRPKAGKYLKPGGNVIAGNTLLYGATGGCLYAAGQVGERLAVRNSGALAVVEGCGDHGCEYMTGGVVVVLGKTGRNFAAGMSGGIAFVFDEDGGLEHHLNRTMAGMEALTSAADQDLLRAVIERHQQLTGSPRAAEMLSDWAQALTRFQRVVPHVRLQHGSAPDLRTPETAALAAMLAEAARPTGIESP